MRSIRSKEMQKKSGKSPVSARRTTQNPALPARAKRFARSVTEPASKWTRKLERRQMSPASDATGPRSAEHGDHSDRQPRGSSPRKYPSASTQAKHPDAVWHLFEGFTQGVGVLNSQAVL